MSYLKIALLTSALSLCLQTFTYGRDITLEWGPSIEPDIDHYVVYWDVKADPPFANNSEDRGDFIDKNTTTYTVTGLDDNTIHYFAATAVNTIGLESDYSNVVKAEFIYVPCGSHTPCFNGIQAAIDAAGAGAFILIAQGTYIESITLNQDKGVILLGGWNPSFTSQTANTTFIKAPKAPQGSITLRMVTVRP